jgi:hypothetical protein
MKEREKMEALKKQRDEIKRERDAISEALDRVKGRVDTAIESGKSARAQLRFRTTEEIDQEITRLERAQATTSMSLGEVRDWPCLIVFCPSRANAAIRPVASTGNAGSLLSQEKKLVKDIEMLRIQKRQLQSLGQNQDQVRPLLHISSCCAEGSLNALLQITRDREEKQRLSAQLKAKRDEFSEIMDRITAQREVSLCRHRALETSQANLSVPSLS